MTRLSEALKKAAADIPIPREPAPSAAGGPAWQFSPVETMHVPPAAAPEAPVEPAPVEPAPATPSGPIRVGESDRAKLVIEAGVDPNVVEQYRQLAATLHHAQKASGVRSVMVTSAMPSEGKTLTATNLALTISQSYQRRVLLIDADLRRPRLREMFALPPTPGLTDSLSDIRGGKLPVHQISPTLWVLTSGRTLPDPMSMLSSPATKQLIDDARDSFDWVIVDTPPIAILPDANLLAAMIDTALLVVSAQSTPYPLVQRAADKIGPQRILGVVLNRAEKSNLNSQNYYDYRHYQQSAPAPEPKRWFNRWRKPAASRQAGHVQ
jgi:capsular exopolysaccharide synthesis family protein